MGVSATDGVGKSESNESWTDVLLVFSKAVAMDSHWGGGDLPGGVHHEMNT